jgi:hypothetical protein
MKIKTDYITNSSSSSFVAWGVSLDSIPFPESVLLKIYDGKLQHLGKIKNESSDRFEKWYKDDYETFVGAKTDEEKIELVEDLEFEDKVSALSLGSGKFSWSQGDPVNAIGISPTDFIEKFPDVPAGKIMETVANELNKSFGTEFNASDIEYYEEAWMDN